MSNSYNYVDPDFTYTEPKTGLLRNLQIFPNPAQNEVNVLLTGINEVTELSVFSVNGQEILKNNAIKSNEVFNLNISEWKGGVYFCKVMYGNNYIMKKFSVIK